jgi:hypothetical protein
MTPSSPSDSRSPARSPAGYPGARSATPRGMVTPGSAVPPANTVGHSRVKCAIVSSAVGLLIAMDTAGRAPDMSRPAKHLAGTSPRRLR